MSTATTFLTGEAKEALRKAVGGLRERLLARLLEAAKSEYRLDVAIEKAKLPEARHERRKRLERWIEEQVESARPAKEAKEKKGGADLRQRFLEQAVKEAAHTLLNRLVVVRILEHHGVIAPAVVTGGWKSPAYAQEFVNYAGPLGTDDTRGYRVLLDAVFAELALDLPGLFGPVGLTPLFPVPAAMLRDVVETLNEPVLESAWGDDTTLGWVYQYWNDPEREKLDAKIAGGGKIEPHEIASKTQMFTERYMVEWLLQNSLGLTWLAICRKNGWTADAERVLPVLEARRAEWRGKRERGEVALDALMPVEAGIESAWKYYVPQPVPADAVEKARGSIREVKLLDPACGSGHFLVIAFGLLAELYREEARHRGETWGDEGIAGSILENNLHGIDIDPRAIQIAAAALVLRAKLFAPGAALRRINLVAPSLRLGELPEGDPALVELCRDLERESGISEALTRELVKGIAGVDYLGSLFKVGDAVRGAVGTALDKLAGEAKWRIERGKAGQGDLFGGFAKQKTELEAAKEAASETVLEKLEAFLGVHSGSEDLGLRLHGEQLAAGVRFVRMVKEGMYDVVAGNPPYQGLSKTERFGYVAEQYPWGKADLYAAFLERGLELVREGGISAMVTMRGWMFLGQFEEFRIGILANHRLLLGDLGWGAFELMTDSPITMSAIQRGMKGPSSFALCPADPTARVRTEEHRRGLVAGLVAQVGRHEFDPKGFKVIQGEPIVYWWTNAQLDLYRDLPKLKEQAVVLEGLGTRNDARYVRFVFETSPSTIARPAFGAYVPSVDTVWVPFIKGAGSKVWLEPLEHVVNWDRNGLQLGTNIKSKFGRGATSYFKQGIAYSTIGANFTVRAHWAASIFSDGGSSLFVQDLADTLCSLNSSRARWVLQSLNPTVNFTNEDVERVPLEPIRDAQAIFAHLSSTFAVHESHREPSFEFTQPGPSSWRHVQQWAQRAVDRDQVTPLAPYEPQYDPPSPEAHVSFAIGIALGRFGARAEGILDTAPASALPAGILLIGPSDHLPDSLVSPAAAAILAAWTEHAPAITAAKKQPLRDWLRKDFFAYHKALYENRPIYFPLSSEKRSFVAYVSIHRFSDNTLQTLLADHLHPVLRQLDGEITDLNASRASSDKKTAVAADKHYATAKRLRDELAELIEAVSQCAERGAPPTDAACPPRKADAPFRMDLDDGVMINSAALWPLLAPQWNDPKKGWKQLCLADGRKNYDWSHLARRYFPARVEEACQKDPSLAVAHGCFWKDHPAKAYAWELRLQDEIRPAFTIDEAGSDEHRARFLAHHAAEARAIEAAEEKRRERKAARAGAEEPEAGGEGEGDGGEGGEDEG